jgi:hypothetical protein
MLFMRKTTALPSAAEALPGRAQPIPTAISHFVNGRQLQPPYPAGLEQAVLLGRRAQILGTGRRHLYHCGGLCRRPHSESDL